MNELSVFHQEQVVGGGRIEAIKKGAKWLANTAAGYAITKAAENAYKKLTKPKSSSGKPSGSCHVSNAGTKYCTGGR